MEPEQRTLDNTLLLFKASKQGNRARVRILIENTDASRRDAFVNETDEDGNTPLYYATSRGHVSLSKYLIEDTNVNLAHKYGPNEDTVLHVLARMSEERDDVLEVVKLLSSANLINSRNNRNKTPLHCAAEFAPNSIFECLLNAECADIFAVDDRNDTILHSLLKSRNEGKIQLVKKLVSMGISIETRGKHEFTPFLAACKFGSRTLCEFLITEMRVDIRAVDYKNRTALHKLALSRNGNTVEIVELLVSKGLSIEARDEEGHTPFLTACAFGTRTFCECLIAELRADIHAVSYKSRTALHSVALNKNENVVDIAKILISKGVSLEARDKSGFTPFLTACAFGTRTFCECLIAELRADIRAVDRRNRTALHILALNKNENVVDIAKISISKGLSLEARDVFGSTPFLAACVFGTRTFCEYLITTLGADIHAVDYNNNTALRNLKLNKNENIIAIEKLLRSKGVDR